MHPSPWKSLIHMYNKTVFSHLRKIGNISVLNHVWQMPAFSGTIFFLMAEPDPFFGLPFICDIIERHQVFSSGVLISFFISGENT